MVDKRLLEAIDKAISSAEIIDLAAGFGYSLSEPEAERLYAMVNNELREEELEAVAARQSQCVILDNPCAYDNNIEVVRCNFI